MRRRRAQRWYPLKKICYLVYGSFRHRQSIRSIVKRVHTNFQVHRSSLKRVFFAKLANNQLISVIGSWGDSYNTLCVHKRTQRYLLNLPAMASRNRAVNDKLELTSCAVKYKQESCGQYQTNSGVSDVSNCACLQGAIPGS